MVRAALTAMAATRPRMFWSELRMEHPSRVRGMLLTLAAGAVLLTLCSLLLHAVVLLLIQTITQNYDLNAWTRYYPLNAALPFVSWEFYSYGYTASAYSWDWYDYPLVPSLIVPAVSVLTVPFMYFVPAVTRERHGVRVAHIIRITLYGTVGLCALLIASLSTRTAMFGLLEWTYGGPRSPARQGGWWVPEIGSAWPRVVTALVFLMTVAWQMVWWTVATRRYLRFDRPGSFAWPLVGVSLLAGFVALIVLCTSTQGLGAYILYIGPW